MNKVLRIFSHQLSYSRAWRISAQSIIIVALLSSCGNTPTQPNSAETVPNANQTSSAVMSPDAQQNYFDALTYINNNTPEKALKTLKELHFSYPQHPFITLNLAIVYIGTEQTDKAQKLVEQLSASGHKSAGFANLRGQLAMESHDFNAAETAFKQAIKLDKAYAPPYYNLARLNDIFYQDIATAYDYYKRYLVLQPNDESVAQWVEELKYSLE